MQNTQSEYTAARHDLTRLSADDLYWLNEGSHFHLYDKLGAHVMQTADGVTGVYFATFAPNAKNVSVIGDFNGWNPSAHALTARADSGVWETFLPGVTPGTQYKFHVQSGQNDYASDKADPYGFRHEGPPSNASVVCPLDYDWGDDEWMKTRGDQGLHDVPVSIYEVHLGSWFRDDAGELKSYSAVAERLADYVCKLGFTHVELMPVTEHPFYGSWGYQSTGYFAPTYRYGTPQELMHLIDYLHQRGIGVIMDWVPGHFPNDDHGLGYFDGTHLYEHPDPRRGIHPEWDSFVFNYERPEVQSFLFSSAFFWADKYHVDGFRVDAVTSMLYLDYGRKEGEWLPNLHGGRENLEAVAFLRRFNTELAARHPDVRTYAEEATSWPMVSRPVHLGGLGFDYKWDMGWMNDTLDYFKQDPIYRKFHHNKITFRMMYAFDENYVLALSHDEVVHGKASLLGRMPGDEPQKFANLRLLLGNQFLQPGKKMLFMGDEIGQWREWNHDTGLDWHLLDYPSHLGIQRWVGDLNRVYRAEPALYELDNDPDGFEWVDCLDSDNSVISFLRKNRAGDAYMLAVFNHTPVSREHYRIGVPRSGFWHEVLNSDAKYYGGNGAGNLGGVWPDSIEDHHHAHSVAVTLPALGCLVFKSAPRPAAAARR